ncbi:MAG: DUF3179 domain-containing protein [Candidatus Poribacteria bacterium]|nr:DUF3179 domain-containing protein [Candidatus Poribacteria bacterium]
MILRLLLVLLPFYGWVLLLGCGTDEDASETKSPSLAEDATEPEFIQTPQTDVEDKPSERVLERYTIFFPDEVKHSIPLNEIRDGGPGIDGKPALTEPPSIPAAAADYLDDTDVVLGISVHGESRAYPLRILVVHEIVNDTLGGIPVLVTFCPECGTGIALDPVVDGQGLEFGVSGMLYKRNLLMYDRGSDTPGLWVQALGEAVVGPKTGTLLDLLPATQAHWSEWKAAHPDTTVLSRDTGFGYHYNPYPDILDFLPKQILGVILGDAQKAYFFDDLRHMQVINDDLGGVPIVLIASPNSDAVRVYERKNHRFEGTFEKVVEIGTRDVWTVSEETLSNAKTGDSLERIPDVFVSFAGAWGRFFPDTLIYERP